MYTYRAENRARIDISRDLSKDILWDIPRDIRHFHRVLELLIGGEFLSYPSLIGQLKKRYPFGHPFRYVSFLGFRLRMRELRTDVRTDWGERSFEGIRYIWNGKLCQLTWTCCWRSGLRLLRWSSPQSANWQGVSKIVCFVVKLNLAVKVPAAAVD